jgi:hypothetical protein
MLLYEKRYIFKSSHPTLGLMDETDLPPEPGPGSVPGQPDDETSSINPETISPSSSEVEKVSGPDTVSEVPPVIIQNQGTEQVEQTTSEALPALIPESTNPPKPVPGPNLGKYAKFKKVDGATYHRVNEFLRKRTYITAREWALARLCTDFRTRGGAEMTFIGQHLPELVPFMQEPYTPQAVNQARNSFKKKVNKAGATFFYGAMCGFFTPDELDDMLFESSEVARFLLEVEGTSLDIDEEIDIEDRITRVMRGVGEAARIMLEKRAASDLAESEGKDLAEHNTHIKTPPEISDLEGTEDSDQDQ